LPYYSKFPTVTEQLLLPAAAALPHSLTEIGLKSYTGGQQLVENALVPVGKPMGTAY
jgi:hypothetical protein